MTIFLNPTNDDPKYRLDENDHKDMEDQRVTPDFVDSPPSKFHKRTKVVLTLSLIFNFLLLDRLLFSKITTIDDFLNMTNVRYAYTSILLTMITSILLGLVLSRILISESGNRSNLIGVQLLLAGGLFFLSIGCPVCGSPVFAALGIQEGLSIFPLAGLELKLLSALLLWSSLKTISRPVTEVPSNQDADMITLPSMIGEGSFTRKIKAGLLPSAAIILLLALPLLPPHWKIDVSNAQTNSTSTSSGSITDEVISQLVEQVIPTDGYEVAVAYGDLGPQLLNAGAIDYDRFVERYDAGGSPLTEMQKEILTEGMDENIVISRDNAHFLLNFFWALGLTNQNPILDEGPMMIYSEGEIGRFASTGGWTLGQKDPTELYSSTTIVSLSPDQQALVEKVSAVVYRPCCNNPTIFPDCNHGMAMLGLLELLAANGSTEADMMVAAKYFNAYWFPQQAVEVAIYFQSTTGVSFDDVDAGHVVGSQIFSGSGFQGVHAWLGENGLLEESPNQGGSCGV